MIKSEKNGQIPFGKDWLKLLSGSEIFEHMATNITANATAGYVADTGSIESILILLVFLIAFALILGEVVDRVLAAWGGAVGMLLVGTYYNSLTWCTGGGHGGESGGCENNLFEAIDFNAVSYTHLTLPTILLV